MSTQTLHLQRAVEAIRGTAQVQTATVPLVDKVEITPGTNSEQIKDMSGTIQRNAQTFKGNSTPAIKVSGKMSYDQSQALFDSIIKKATATDALGVFTRSWLLSEVDVSQAESYSFYYGNSQAAYRLAGSVMSKLEVVIENGKPVMYTADYQSMSLEQSSMQTIAKADVSLIGSSHATLFLDAIDTDPVNTPIPCTVFSVKLIIDSKRSHIHAIGSRSACDFNEGEWDVKLELSVYIPGTGSVTKDLLTQAIATSADLMPSRSFRILFTDPANADNQFEFTFSGDVMGEPKVFEDTDGSLSTSFSLSYRSTSSTPSALTINTSNEVSVTP